MKVFNTFDSETTLNCQQLFGNLSLNTTLDMLYSMLSLNADRDSSEITDDTINQSASYTADVFVVRYV